MDENEGSRPNTLGMTADMDFDVVSFKYEKNNSLALHSKPITSMKLNTSGDILATCSEDHYIRITNLFNKKEIGTIYNQDRHGLDLELHS